MSCCGRRGSGRRNIGSSAPKLDNVKYCECGGIMQHEKMKVVSKIKIYKYRCYACKKSMWQK